MISILKGDISITDNESFVRDIIVNPISNIKIISLEEVSTLPLDSPNVLAGATLLPPIEALIAAADGDEALFDEIYFNYYNTREVVEYVSAVITYLYRGGSFILFYPEDDHAVKGKFLDMFWKRYGIMIGEVGVRQSQYDIMCTPIWLESIYNISGISSLDLLYLYPKEALIEDRLIYKLVMDISPPGESYQEKAQDILRLRDRLKEHRDLIIPFTTKGAQY